MMSIELRWLVIPCGENIEGRKGILSESERVIRVLQWRQEPAGGGGGTFGNAPPDHDWQDVPQVVTSEQEKESQEVWNAADRIYRLETENAKLKKALAEIRAIGEEP